MAEIPLSVAEKTFILHGVDVSIINVILWSCLGILQYVLLKTLFYYISEAIHKYLLVFTKISISSSKITSSLFQHLLVKTFFYYISETIYKYLLVSLFFIRLFQTDFRNDGRTWSEYRWMEVETKLMDQVHGSARLRLGNSDVLVGVKVEIDTPFPDRPYEGKLEFFVDWYEWSYNRTIIY